MRGDGEAGGQVLENQRLLLQLFPLGSSEGEHSFSLFLLSAVSNNRVEVSKKEERRGEENGGRKRRALKSASLHVPCY